MEICAHSQSEQQEDWGCICYIIHIFPETRLLNINCLKDTVVIINIMETWMKHELGCTHVSCPASGIVPQLQIHSKPVWDNSQKHSEGPYECKPSTKNNTIYFQCDRQLSQSQTSIRYEPQTKTRQAL